MYLLYFIHGPPVFSILDFDRTGAVRRIVTATRLLVGSEELRTREGKAEVGQDDVLHTLACVRRGTAEVLGC